MIELVKMVDNKKTILFAPMNAWGHIHASVGLAQELQSRSHRVVWAIDQSFAGKLSAYGFEEELVGKEVDPNSDDKEYWQNFMEKHTQTMKEEPLVILEKFNVPSIYVMYQDTKDQDSQFKAIIARVKPDLLVLDRYVASPALTQSGVPWVWMFSAAPHYAFVNEKKMPPPWAGIPSNADPQVKDKYMRGLESLFRPLHEDVKNYFQSHGGSYIPYLLTHPFSPWLNIFLYPNELHYTELEPLPDNWIRVENFLRITPGKFEIPAQLKDKPGKLVYLSMGSFGCANLELMTRLTGILSKSKHRFIVAKGPVFESHPLPDNMWGERFLPQTNIIPLVDLVITHGGNNSTTETFYFGKPMLILPLFGDQFDNAQRVEEKDLGLRLSPFHCTEHQLLSAVDRLVADEGLARRMTAIGQRIRESEDKKIVAQKIEYIMR